jgi:dienelactone hydrolase
MPSTRAVSSSHDSQEHEGLLVYEAGGPRPTVLVFHDWSGRGPSQEGFAHRLAALGYNAFAVDLYGKGKRGETPDECQALMGPLVGDRALLRRRLLETVDVAAALPEVDAARLAAIGFCFGGLCVLDLARAGGAVRGVASFHGLFTPTGLPSVTPIKPKIVAYHGWADPMAKPDTVVALAEELTDAGADWQLHAFGGAMHAFMVEGANMPTRRAGRGRGWRSFWRRFSNNPFRFGLATRS